MLPRKIASSARNPLRRQLAPVVIAVGHAGVEREPALEQRRVLAHHQRFFLLTPRGILPAARLADLHRFGAGRRGRGRRAVLGQRRGRFFLAGGAQTPAALGHLQFFDLPSQALDLGLLGLQLVAEALQLQPKVGVGAGLAGMGGAGQRQGDGQGQGVAGGAHP